MAGTIAFASTKGGTGKTTVSLNLAVALAESGARALLVDMDPQGGIAHALGRDDTQWKGIADIIAGEVSRDEALMLTKLPNLAVLPRGRLNPVHGAAFEHAMASTGLVRETLEWASGEAEFVLVDCPSGLGPVTRSVLRAVDWLVLPMQAEPASIRTSSQILELVEHLRSHEQASVRLLGVVATMVDLQSDPSVNVMRTLWREFGGVFDTVIPRAQIFVSASEAGVPVGFTSPTQRPEGQRFAQLASELKARIHHEEHPGEEESFEPRQLI